MIIISLAQEIDLEQDLIITILNSALRNHGSEKVLARQVGVTPVHLSYVRKGKRMLRVPMAQTLARVLPLPSGEQQLFVDHVARYWQLKRQVTDIAHHVTHPVVDEVLDEVREASFTATFANDPSVANRYYGFVARAASELLAQCQPEQSPTAYLELSCLLHDTYSVLNRQIDALYIAKRARLVAETLEASDFRQNNERFDFLEINAMRAEAVSLHNLYLAREAYEVCGRLQGQPAMQRHSLFWKPHVYRDQLNALGRLPRFAISEAEDLASEGVEICEKRGESADELLALLLQRSLAQAYIQHHNYKDARRILEAKYRELAEIPLLGSLHRTLFLRTFAQLCWQEAEKDRWQQLISEAITLATQANLRHQLAEIQQEYPGQSLPISSDPKLDAPESFDKAHGEALSDASRK